ncbi:hypothetical protein Q5O14_01860 [Eubacteriaceae bacterium ES2]|nr:hypothetical protein Q5O14_01860 [Eubacteriaceae bacterium ES2]
MKTEPLTTQSTLELFDNEKIFTNVPKDILYSEITYCPKVWINTDKPGMPLEWDTDQSPTFAPMGSYNFTIDFKTDFSRIEDDDSTNDCLCVSFFIEDQNEEFFSLTEYIGIPHSTPAEESPAMLFYQLFGLSKPNSCTAKCSGKASLVYLTRDDGLPPFAILGNFILD